MKDWEELDALHCNVLQTSLSSWGGNGHVGDDVDHDEDVDVDDEALHQQPDGLAKCILVILQYLSTCKRTSADVRMNVPHQDKSRLLHLTMWYFKIEQTIYRPFLILSYLVPRIWVLSIGPGLYNRLALCRLN